MKIAILSTYYGTNIGGAEVSTKIFIDELLKRRYDVEVICATNAESKNLIVHKIPFFNKYPKPLLIFDFKMIDYFIYKQIKKILKRIRPDVLHIQEFELSYPALRAAKSLGIKTVMTVRDHRFVCNLPMFDKSGEPVQEYSKKEYMKLLKNMSKQRYNLKILAYILYHWLKNKPKRFMHVVKNADAVVSVSNYIKKLLVKNGVRGDSVECIYNLLPTELENKKFSGRGKRKSVTIFAAGRLEDYKGFNVLIKAFSQIEGNVNLVIAGTGTDEKRLRELASNVGVAKRVRFTGRLRIDEIYGHYSNADVTVLPSLWAEPLSRVVWEAFTFKVPLIATDTGGTGEFVKNNKTGLLVKPNDVGQLRDAITKLLNSSKLREKLAKNAAKMIEAHNKKQLNKYVRKYMELGSHL